MNASTHTLPSRQFLAIAVETSKHPKNKSLYKVWYLELDVNKEVISVGVKTKDELVSHLMDQYRMHGRSLWRAFLKGKESSTPVDLFDFISMNLYQNTHFGHLPTLKEFQYTLDHLESSLEIRSIA